jgi:hypothetical protein
VKRGQLRALRTIGIAFVVIGGIAVVLGLAGYVATRLHFAHLECPGDGSPPECFDRMLGLMIYWELGSVGVIVAGVGGMLAWRAKAAARRKASWSR